MTFNVLEFCRQRESADRLLVEPGGLRRRAPACRGGRRARRAPTSPTRSRTYSASKIAGEAFVYSYARCYGPALPRLPLLERLRALRQRPRAHGARPAALHPHDAARRAGHGLRRQEKTLDFTYVDDCIDGITRGIEALAEGRVVNETINLAYGQGNSLVHAAELIAGELGVEPKIALAPSLLGEVTHYVADLTKARELLGYEPAVPLEEGIARCGRLVQGASRRASRRRRAARRPTSSSRRMQRLAGSQSRQLLLASSRSSARPRRARRPSQRRSPIASAVRSCPPIRCRRIGACRFSRRSPIGRHGLVGIWPLDPRGLRRRVRPPGAHSDRRAGRRRPHPGRRRRHRPLPSRRARGARACHLPRAQEQRALVGARSTTGFGPERAYAVLAERDPERRSAASCE